MGPCLAGLEESLRQRDGQKRQQCGDHGKKERCVRLLSSLAASLFPGIIVIRHFASLLTGAG
jgi:hypothetical protein